LPIGAGFCCPLKMFFLGLRPGPLSTELCFYGPAARLFLPSGQVFRLSASHFFFARAKKK